MSADELAKAVAKCGALPMPVPVGPEPLSAERLAEIEARAGSATAGPWCTDAWEIYQGTEYVPGISFWIGETCRGTSELGQDRADAAFVAAARSDVPELVAEVRRQAARIAELEAQRERRRVRLVALSNDALSMRGSLSPMGEDRKVPFPLGETLTPAVDWLIGRVAELEARPSPADVLRQAADDLTAACPDHGDADEAWMDCPCEFADELRRKAALVGSGGDACTCPPADRVEPHQVGCALADVPLLGERPVNELTAVFSPVASLREPEGEHYPFAHHDYRVSHDLPETGGGPVSTGLVEPNGCSRCGVPEREHFQRWKKPASGPGWHKWIAPSQVQIKARMLARRAARKQGAS